MPLIQLETMTKEGTLLQAIFSPEHGMNLLSFKKGEIEVIDSSTLPIFEERLSGLGPLIGPHFHRRKTEILPLIPNEALFPHIARIRAKGIKDPFSHGIARYAPWTQISSTSTSFYAILEGKEIWNGISLATLEGQNFKYIFKGELKKEGLFLELSIVSDTSSLVGIHYYYRLPNGKGIVKSQVQSSYLTNGRSEPTPTDLVFPLDREVDFTFRPFPDPLKGTIFLETEEYLLKTLYTCDCEENSWQLYHPAGASFVCIEPLSAQDPRHCNLTVSSLKIHLEILDPTN